MVGILGRTLEVRSQGRGLVLGSGLKVEVWSQVSRWGLSLESEVRLKSSKVEFCVKS